MGWMSIDPNLEEQQLLEETLRRTGLRLTPRERLGEAASLAAFVGATAALWLEGQKMLDRVGGFMRDVGQIVRAHHERWDGAGYPDGVAGEQIPLEARIISCCDRRHPARDRLHGSRRAAAGQSRCSRCATAAAWVRLRTPSLLRIRDTCTLAVFSAMYSAAPICRLVAPSATSTST